MKLHKAVTSALGRQLSRAARNEGGDSEINKKPVKL